MPIHLKKHQRLLFIIDQLANKQRVRVKSLAKLLNITERSVRNGLKVIITLASQDCLYYDGKTYLHFPAFKAVPVDTSGALANDDIIEHAIKYASAFVSLAVERKGASNMPTHGWVIKRIETEKEYTFKKI